MTSSVPTHTRNQPKNRNRNRHNKDPCFCQKSHSGTLEQQLQRENLVRIPWSQLLRSRLKHENNPDQKLEPSDFPTDHAYRNPSNNTLAASTQHEGMLKSLACRVQTLRLQPKRIEHLSGKENASASRQAPSNETLAEELRSTQRGMQFNNVPTMLARLVAQGGRASSFQKKKLLKASSPPLMFCHIGNWP